MKTKLNLHPTKIWAIIYPIFAKEFWQMTDYNQFADLVSTMFILTPEQWDKVLAEWEFKTIITE